VVCRVSRVDANRWVRIGGSGLQAGLCARGRGLPPRPLSSKPVQLEGLDSHGLFVHRHAWRGWPHGTWPQAVHERLPGVCILKSRPTRRRPRRSAVTSWTGRDQTPSRPQPHQTKPNTAKPPPNSHQAAGEPLPGGGFLRSGGRRFFWI
jgi:hypothetical protein